MYIGGSCEEDGEQVVRPDASGGAGGDRTVVLDFESFLEGVVELPSKSFTCKGIGRSQPGSGMTRCIKLVIQDFKSFPIEEVEKRLGVSGSSSHVGENTCV